MTQRSRDDFWHLPDGSYLSKAHHAITGINLCLDDGCMLNFISPDGPMWRTFPGVPVETVARIVFGPAPTPSRPWYQRPYSGGIFGRYE